MVEEDRQVGRPGFEQLNALEAAALAIDLKGGGEVSGGGGDRPYSKPIRTCAGGITCSCSASK